MAEANHGKSAEGAAGEAKINVNMILPPPAIRVIVDKTAAFVAKSPHAASFEDKIKAREKSDSRFAFLNKEDAYHAYYQHRLEAFRAGEVAPDSNLVNKSDVNGLGDVATLAAGQQSSEQQNDDGRPKQPPDLEFLVESPPPMNAVDLDIIRLTALFTARSGRKFTSELASRESRNYQFDFLRPSHSLFGYFNRLVEQYTKILIPSKESQARLERRSGGPAEDDQDRLLKGRREVLADTKERVQWEHWESSKRKELEDAEEAERIAFAEIDWQDFVVVSTVEFTEGDEAGLIELPPPMTLAEVENMTMAQKKMAAMIMEGRDDEIAEGDEPGRRGEEVEMDMDDGDDDAAPSATPSSAPATSSSAIGAGAPMKIRKDYVPKAKRAAESKQAYTTFGDQQVPVEDFAEHVRIELLDPRWKEDKRQSEANRSASNLLPGGTDVSESIRSLAAHRPDIFGKVGDEELKRRQAEALALSKAREAQVWDGHTASKDATTARYQAAGDVGEQISALHRVKGAPGPEEGEGEPQIGPSVPAPAPVVPEQPNAFKTGATFSAAPQPNQTSVTPGQAQYGQGPAGMGGFPPQFASGPPPAGLPMRPPGFTEGTHAAMTSYGGSVPPGRPAEDDFDRDRAGKRARIEKRTDGSTWPEAEWLASHSEEIQIRVQLPDYPSKPAWGCDGSEFEMQVPLKLLVGTVRDRIASKCGLPISKQKFTYNGKILANSSSLASLNFEDGDVLQVSVKEKK